MSKNIDLEKDAIRRRLISYIQEKITFPWKEIPLKETHLTKEIGPNNFTISPDINGTPFLLIFAELDTAMYSLVAINAGNSYDLRRADIPAKASIYKGTIICGKYLPGVISSCQLTDIYYHKGDCLINFKRSDRYERLMRVINEKEIMSSDSFQLYLAFLIRINCTNLLQLLSRTIERTDFTKWIFYPEEWPSKKKYVYGYELQDGDRINNPQTMHKMEMKKSKTPDIYYLTDLETGVTDIASVKQSEKSHLYRGWFKNADKRIIKCIHDARDNSWQPMVTIDDNI